jgi:hypothetical protein
MRRKRLLVFLALGLAGAYLLLRLRAPRPVEQPPPPVVERPKRPLQADAEGSYVPGYGFEVNSFRFTGFSLHPEALVTFAPAIGGRDQPMGCIDALIRAETFHLRCDYPHVGTVTIDGKFLTRWVTDRADAAVASAVVTVRSGSGEILYSARDSFQWRSGD